MSLRRSWFASSLLSTTLMTVAACGSSDDAAPPSAASGGAAGASGGAGGLGGGGAGGAVPGSDVKDLLSLPVDKDGPFLVGYRTFSHTYTPKGQTEPRKIAIHIWYPASETNDENPNYGPILDSKAFKDAAPMAPVDPAGYPVIVHSHGSSAFAGSSPFLVHRFVSNGWVFVAPDHTGNLLLDPPNAKDRPVAMYYERPLDITQALEALAKDAALGAKARVDKVVMTGHSFGGYTTWASAGAKFDAAAVKKQCESGNFKAPCTQPEIDAFATDLSEPRVVAAIPMAGGNDATDWFGPTGQDQIKIPVFIMTGSEDNAPTGAEAMGRITGVALTWIDIQGGCHQTFSLGGCKNISDDDSFSIVSTYSYAFARRHVLGDKSDRTLKLLDGTEMFNPRVTLQKKNQP